MKGLIATLLQADARTPLFARGGEWVTAGDVRETAARATLPAGDGPIFLHVASAAHFCTGLLAAAAERRALALPAHAQPSYMAEVGADALVSDEDFAHGAAARALDAADPDPLLAFYTSGSTGTPKRVEKNLSRLEREAAALDGLWGESAAHVVATVSHQHIYGLLFRIVWPLLSGRTSDDAAAAYWEDLEGRLGNATLVSSPAHLSRLSPRADLYAAAPALIFSSGQLLTAEAAQACIVAFGRPVTEVLGSTETGGIAWRRQTEPDAPWTPLPGVEIQCAEDGALSVASPFLQEQRPQPTGDVVAPLADGRFRLMPRGDRVVKIDGKRVSLTRVERALAALPEVSAAAALTLPDRKDALAAVVALSPSGHTALAARGAFRLSRKLRSALADKVEPAERPKHWRFVDDIPTDAQGKRVLSTLRAMFASGPLDALDLNISEQKPYEAEITFTLPPELIYFKGHFPQRAILPGLAQVHLACLIAQKLWGAWPSDSDLARLKFRRVLLPGDEVALKLNWNPDAGRLRFAYRFKDIDAAQGEIGGLKN